MAATGRRSVLRSAAALLGGASLSRPSIPVDAPSDVNPEPLRIGGSLQLFVDDFFVEKMSGLRLQLQSPRFADTAIAFDRPWEGNVSGYVTVLKDGAKYRMYYRGLNLPEYYSPKALTPQDVVHPKNRECVCYAESGDGIRWTKPSLGLFGFNGSRTNNTVHVGDGRHNFAPFLDPNPAAAPNARYKALGGSRSLFAFQSDDGLRWEKMRPEPVLTDGAFDSQNVPFYDSVRARYVAIYRDFRQGVRTIRCAHSQDFIDWTPGVWADYGDAPLEQLYTNATVPYFRPPQVYLAFPMRFVPWLEPLGDVPGKGVSEAVFMTSRDGVRWNRRFMEALVRPGPEIRNWVHRNNMVAAGVHQTDPGEMSIYVQRHYTFPSARLERMTLRLDGFVSVHAGYSGGVLTTRPFILEGPFMVLNFATSAVGSVRYEIIDEHGHPLPGLSIDQTRPIYGDDVERKVAVQPVRRNERSALAARPVRLRFHFRDADLYSVKFQD